MSAYPPLVPPADVGDACQQVVEGIQGRFGPLATSLFLYSKQGLVERHALISQNDDGLPPEEAYAGDDPHLRIVLGADADQRRGKVAAVACQDMVGAAKAPYVAAFGPDATVTDFPLNGPNRTYGFVRLITGPAADPLELGEVSFRVDNAGLMISTVRRRLELDALNKIREHLTWPPAQINEVLDEVANVLVLPWTEYSVAIIRTRHAKGDYVVRGLGCAHGLVCPDRDHQPRRRGVGYVGYVLESGMPVFVDDISPQIGQFDDADWITSNHLGAFACVPIKYGNKTLGTLSVFVAFKYTFFDSKRRFLVSLCNQLGDYMNLGGVAKAHAGIERLTKSILTPNNDADTVLFAALAAACEVADADFGYVALGGREDQMLHPKAWSQTLESAFIPPINVEGRGLVPLAFKTGRPVNCGDVRADSDLARNFVDLLGPHAGVLKSELVIPIIYEDEPIGVLAVGAPFKDHFAHEDSALLTTIADHTAVFYHKQRLYHAAERLAALHFDIGETDLLYERIVAAACDIGDSGNVCLYIVEESGAAMNLRASRHTAGVSPHTELESRLPAGIGRAWEALASREIRLVRDIQKDSAFLHSDFAKRNGFSAMLVVPLWLDEAGAPPDGAELGVVCLFVRRQSRFAETELALLKALATASAFALQGLRDRQSLEQAFENAERNAHKVSVAEIAVGVAHDVRNILNQVITTYHAIRPAVTKLAQANGNLRLERQVVDIGERLEQLTYYFERIRHYSRLANPRFELSDPNAVVRDVLRICDHKLTRQKVKLKQDLRDVQPIRIDYEQLFRAVINVVLNSLEAMKSRGGALFVGTDYTADGDYVRLRVIDDGTGMDDDVRTRIFQPYFTTKGEGTGMGLPIVRQIVEDLHNGRVEIESKRGRGTTVSLLLPVVTTLGEGKDDK